MIILNNVDLRKKTTFHIGGVAQKFYIPENKNELIEIADRLYNANKKLYIISGGSNLLINDNRVFSDVISMSKACMELQDLDKGIFYIGASNKIQNVIKYLNNLGYGGFEELIGLPALFGGIINMNAGIGSKNNCLFTISDFIIDVLVYDLENHITIKMPKNECLFSHRDSLFKNGKYVILGATIKAYSIEKNILKQKIDKRKEFCREKFEYGKGCFGTLFSECNSKILKGISVVFKHAGDVSFGKNNSNWLVNNGEGTYKDSMKLIRACNFFHKIMRKKLQCEVVIWK